MGTSAVLFRSACISWTSFTFVFLTTSITGCANMESGKNGDWLSLSFASVREENYSTKQFEIQKIRSELIARTYELEQEVKKLNKELEEARTTRPQPAVINDKRKLNKLSRNSSPFAEWMKGPFFFSTPDPPYQENLQKIYFATDRKKNKDIVFGTIQASTMTYGTRLVSIPSSHKKGEIELPTLWKLEFSPKRTRHMVTVSQVLLSEDKFFDDINRTLKIGKKDSILIFVHGYNVSFEDAVLRTAQIAYDLHFPGASILYSWPSQGKLEPYMADEQNSERTQHNLQNFLLELSKRTGTSELYVIAHSMGNRPVTRALAELSKNNKNNISLITELILAAPDIDATVFKNDIAPFLSNISKSITIYASDNDKALLASEKIHTYPRLGQMKSRPIYKGFETIDASKVDTDFLGHSYVTDKSALLEDLFYIISSNVRANKRAALREAPTKDYWIFDQ